MSITRGFKDRKMICLLTQTRASRRSWQEVLDNSGGFDGLKTNLVGLLVVNPKAIVIPLVGRGKQGKISAGDVMIPLVCHSSKWSQIADFTHRFIEDSRPENRSQMLWSCVQYVLIKNSLICLCRLFLQICLPTLPQTSCTAGYGLTTPVA